MNHIATIPHDDVGRDLRRQRGIVCEDKIFRHIQLILGTHFDTLALLIVMVIHIPQREVFRGFIDVTRTDDTRHNPNVLSIAEHTVHLGDRGAQNQNGCIPVILVHGEPFISFDREDPQGPKESHQLFAQQSMIEWKSNLKSSFFHAVDNRATCIHDSLQEAHPFRRSIKQVVGRDVLLPNVARQDQQGYIGPCINHDRRIFYGLQKTLEGSIVDIQTLTNVPNNLLLRLVRFDLL